MEKKLIKDILSSDFKIFPLKPLNKRIRNSLIKPEKRQPIVKMLVTDDGRKYKMLYVGESNKKKLSRILEMKHLFEQIDFIPKIIWSDEHHIIVEFIEGEFPNPSGSEFAMAYAKNLVLLHNLEINLYSTDKLVNDIRKDLDYLVSNGAIDLNLSKNIFNKMLLIKPHEIQTSYVYADSKATNFVFTPERKLFFIDIGSFQNNMITDEFLLRSKLYKKLDSEAFKKSYMASGGSKFLFENEDFLYLVNSIKMGAYQLRVYQGLPFYDWRKKKGRNFNVHKMVSGLKSKIAEL